MADKVSKLRQVLADMIVDVSVIDDEPARLLIGSLANQFVTHAGARTWEQFNSNLSQRNFKALLTTIQQQGQELARQGLTDQLHAVEVIGTALVAKTQSDTDFMLDSARLDALIDDAIVEFRQSQAISPIIS